MAINKAQLSKKLALLVLMLPRGNTYLPRVTARYAFPPNTVGTRKNDIDIDTYNSIITNRLIEGK